MNITVTIDGEPITLDQRQETVRELLRLASDASGRAKYDRVLRLHPRDGGDPIDYFNPSLRVLLHDRMRFTTRRH